MKRLARLLTVAFALSFITVSAAEAGRAAPAKQQAKQKLSGQQARAAIVKNRKAKQKPVNKLKIRKTQNHKKMTEYTAADGNGKVEKYQVKNDGSYAREGGGKASQAQGRKSANQQMHRERDSAKGKKGQFSGVRNSGITDNGNYRFTSKTDKNERVYVNANTGKTRRVDGKGAKKSPKKSAK